MPARACDTMLLDPSIVNSLLIVPVIVMPRRLSLSIGRCSAYRPLERCAGDEPRQAIGRSIPKRNFADELGVDHLPDGRAARLELRALADDEHRL